MNAIDKAVACASTAIAPTATEKSDNAAAQARKTKAVNTDRTEHRHRSRRHPMLVVTQVTISAKMLLHPIAKSYK